MNTTCEDVSLVQCCRLGETGWCSLPPGLLQQVNINRGGRTGGSVARDHPVKRVKTFSMLGCTAIYSK